MNTQNKNFELHTISEDQVSPHIQAELLSRSELYTAPSAPPLDIQDMNLLKFEHGNGDTSYLGEHIKTYQNGQVESNTYIVDINQDSRLTGKAEIRFAADREDSYFKNKPFVGWTETLEDFRGEGLGRRRLLVMNTASLALYGHLLHSGTLQHDPAVSKMWDRLVEEDLATRYSEVDSKTGEELARYHFTE
jgi:hypothetical protein